MRVKKLLLFSMLLFSLNVSCISTVLAQEDSADCGCQTTSINIGTGINPVLQTPLAPGQYEPSWILTTVPSNASINTPATPFVITDGGSVWGQNNPTLKAALVADASYISAVNDIAYSTNNPPPLDPFTFRLDFCVCSDGQYNINGLLNGDDEVSLHLDGNPTPIASCTNWADIITVSTTVNLAQGAHFLELRLRNTGGQAMGVGLSGTISSAVGATSLMGYHCCHPQGGITGQKFLDENCNGIIDDDDPIAPGWTFVLNPGNIVVTTDVSGTFSFPALAPGVYTLSEVIQPGWNAVLPNTAGTITVNVTAGEVTIINFLNTECESGCEKECYWRVTGNNTINPDIHYLGTNTDAALIIKTDATERARIEGTGDGNMGIATNAPTTILHTYAAPPPGGAPSGLRFEELPWGDGFILVTDDEGYVYRSEMTPGAKGMSAMETLQLQQQVNDLKKEISALKAMLTGSEETSFSVSPNPTNGHLSVTFHLAQAYQSAHIKVVDNTGKTVLDVPVQGGDGTVSLTLPQTSASGNLMCTLFVDGKAVATRKVVLLNK